MPKFEKSEGLTPSEKYLGELCEKSFLSLWSWPNVFHIKGNGTQKHELCDLLVVFDKHVIIFSDKSCAFRETDFENTDDIQLSWARWYRKSITESKKQLYRAERFIRNHPERLFIDQACSIPFPVEFPPKDEMVIHRIAVALNIKEPCISFFGDGSGSLPLNTGLDENNNHPFRIGKFKNGKHVHVFDDFTLNTIMAELDTIIDFAGYLEKKTTLIESSKTLLVTGEEELLAQYLLNFNDEEGHVFPYPPEYNMVFVPEGDWEELQKKPPYIAKKKADKISYHWDYLIELFGKNILGGTIEGEQSFLHHELGLRALTSESRFGRRCLARFLADTFEKSKGNERYARIMRSPSNQSKAYIFLILDNTHNLKYAEYRNVRQNLLAIYCKVLHYKIPTLETIVALGFDSTKRKGGSEDLIHYACTQNLSSEEIEEVRQLQADLNILNSDNIIEKRYSASDYPQVEPKKPVYEVPTGMNRKQRRKYLSQMRKKNREH